MSWERTYPYPVSPLKGASEDHFPFPQVGYVSSLEGILLSVCLFLFVFRFSWGVPGCRGVPGVALVTSILICILWIVVVYYTVVWQWYV